MVSPVFVQEHMNYLLDMQLIKHRYAIICLQREHATCILHEYGFCICNYFYIHSLKGICEKTSIA